MDSVNRLLGRRSLLLRIGDDEHRLPPGAYAFGPRGVPHAYRNTGDGPVRMLVVFTPGNFVRMNEELEELGPFDLEGESDMQRMLPILEKYGVRWLAPHLKRSD
jgi:crotonobetainyl-CoA:carnitine CoA-transferase CaiB-like acyl-CoA transferase